MKKILLHAFLSVFYIINFTYAESDIENDTHDNSIYLEQYFLELDINKNGQIDKKDIERFSKNEFNEMDKNNDNILTKKEFFTYICKNNCIKDYCNCTNIKNIDDTEYIKEFWDKMDKDGNGKITFQEKLNFDIENFLIMDINGDGVISRSEAEAQLY